MLDMPEQFIKELLDEQRDQIKQEFFDALSHKVTVVAAVVATILCCFITIPTAIIINNDTKHAVTVQAATDAKRNCSSVVLLKNVLVHIVTTAYAHPQGTVSQRANEIAQRDEIISILNGVNCTGIS